MKGQREALPAPGHGLCITSSSSKAKPEALVTTFCPTKDAPVPQPQPSPCSIASITPNLPRACNHGVPARVPAVLLSPGRSQLHQPWFRKELIPKESGSFSHSLPKQSSKTSSKIPLPQVLPVRKTRDAARVENTSASTWLGMETGSSPGWNHQDGSHLHLEGSRLHPDGSIRLHLTSPLQKLRAHASILLLLLSAAAAAPVCSKGHLNAFISSTHPFLGGFNEK